MASLWKGSVNLFYSQVGWSDYLSKSSKCALVYSQAEGQGLLKQAI